MARFSLKVKGIEEINKKFEALSAKSPTVVLQVLFTSAEAILIPAIKKRLRIEDRIFEGQLFSRISARTLSRKKLEPSIKVGTIGVPYGLNIEKGSPPSILSADEIKKVVKWSKLKFAGDAIIILRTLRTIGAKAHPFLLPTFDATKGALIKDFKERVGIKLGIK